MCVNKNTLLITVIVVASWLTTCALSTLLHMKHIIITHNTCRMDGITNMSSCGGIWSFHEFPMGGSNWAIHQPCTALVEFSCFYFFRWELTTAVIDHHIFAKSSKNKTVTLWETESGGAAWDSCALIWARLRLQRRRNISMLNANKQGCPNKLPWSSKCLARFKWNQHGFIRYRWKRKTNKQPWNTFGLGKHK